MPKKRKLSDLYVLGAEVEIDDGSGQEPVKVWVQKLTPLQQEKTLRRANGARSSVLSARNLPADSEERLVYQHELEEISKDRDAMIDYLISDKLGLIYQVEESRLAEEDEWKKDGYLQGLSDAWNDTLKDRYAVDPEDDEARRNFEEQKRFAEIVEKAVEGERKSLVKDYSEKTDEQLEAEVLDKVLESAADLEWLKEYRRCEVWFFTRELDDHNALYFESRDEVDELALETFGALLTAYNDLRVDVIEGKDSEGTPVS